MYTATVLALLFVLPTACGIVELMTGQHMVAAVFLRWFVFWAVGVRLLMAGASQMLRPRYTAGLLGLHSDDALFPIRELGFANMAMGVVGAMSVVLWTWRVPAAVAGLIFYGLAGLNHRSTGKGTAREKVAMASDLGIAVILAVLTFLVWRGGR